MTDVLDISATDLAPQLGFICGHRMKRDKLIDSSSHELTLREGASLQIPFFLIQLGPPLLLICQARAKRKREVATARPNSAGRKEGGRETPREHFVIVTLLPSSLHLLAPIPASPETDRQMDAEALNDFAS